MKKDKIKIFLDEVFSKPSMRIYLSNKIIKNLFEEIWSIDLPDVIDYKTRNNKGFRYIFIMIDNFSKHLSCVPLNKKNSQTIKNEFSNIFINIKTKTSYNRKRQR